MPVLSMGVAPGMLAESMEERAAKGRRPERHAPPERTAVRHRHESGKVRLDWPRALVEQPRPRSADSEREEGLRDQRAIPRLAIR